MSCDWHLYCRTCDSEHDFCDANHREELMHALIQHAPAIAAMKPLLIDAPGVWSTDITFTTTYGPIDIDWFVTHAGHDLVPRSEYGEISIKKPSD